MGIAAGKRNMGMRLLFLLFLLGALSLAKPPARIAEAAGPQGRPARETPRALAEVWLRFHAADLCQDIDATFAFQGDGMEVRSLVRQERSYQRFQQMLEPLRSSFMIELYATRPPAEKESDEKKNPPPSLWQNYELRSYLGDPFARERQHMDFEAPPQSDPSVGDRLLKSRLMAFGDQMLDWSGKMERYAADLPALVSMALETFWPRELRLLAASVCKAHSQKLQKYAERLDRNLIHALPKSSGKNRGPLRSGKPAAEKSIVKAAEDISAAAQNAARRIRNFIYPEHYTVDLDELRRSSLLDSLRELRSMSADFHKALGKTVRE